MRTGNPLRRAKFDERAISRGVALLLAILVQLTLITLFNHRRQRILQPPRAMILIRIAEQADASVAPPAQPVELTWLPERASVPSSKVREPASPPQPDAESSAPVQLDTGAIAAEAVAKLIEEENRRHLDGRKPFKLNEPTVPSIFTAPRHSFGDEEHDPATEETKIWHSENCYTLLQPPDPHAVELPLKFPTCMFTIGKPEPRGDLFEHLKKPKPLPEAKPGVPVELAYPEKE
jgi:hypothetical protein